jgi:hypothetical protein
MQFRRNPRIKGHARHFHFLAQYLSEQDETETLLDSNIKAINLFKILTTSELWGASTRPKLLEISSGVEPVKN